MDGQRLIIETDVEDWHQEFQRLQPEFQDDDDIVAFVLDGHSTAQTARMAVVVRELKLSPLDIINPNKLLLQSGAREEVTRKVGMVKHSVTMPSGRDYEVRTYIGTRFAPNQEEEEDEPSASFVEAESDAGLRLAINYLDRNVPAFIFERFKQIVMRDGDVLAAADRLHDEIDSMVTRLTEPLAA